MKKTSAKPAANAKPASLGEKPSTLARSMLSIPKAARNAGGYFAINSFINVAWSANTGNMAKKKTRRNVKDSDQMITDFSRTRNSCL